MRFVRRLSVAVIIYGLSYMRHAVTQMYMFFTDARGESSQGTFC